MWSNRLKELTLGVGLTLLSFACDSGKEEDLVGEVLVKSIEIQGEAITDGGSSLFSVVILPENASNKNVAWSVSNESVATINQEGLLSAVSNGSVLVTAIAQDVSGMIKSKLVSVSGVVDPVLLVESITISGESITNGSPTQLTATVLPENADNKEIIWSVSDESVATVSQEGLLSPKQNGQVTVSALAQDGSGVSGELTVEIAGVEIVEGIIVTTSQELLTALASATAGAKIYVRGGVYTFTAMIRLDKSGTADNPISLLAHPNEATRPKFDFSGMAESSSNRGIQISGDYWYVKGLDVFGAGDNGMFISGDNNLIEFCTFSENADTGLQIGNGAKSNTVLNCDSYYNADSSIENADGFACKLDAGDGNAFIGCRAWQNLDDGWDGYLRGADNITTVYENCWAIRNGKLKSGANSGGDGNGFKTGGSDDKLLKHHAIFKNCIAAGNVVDGFDHNSNRGDVQIINSTGHANGRNISFGSGNSANALTIKNTGSLEGGSTDQLVATTTEIGNNSWQNGLSAEASDYVSLNIDLLLSPRKPDGSLPDIDYLKLVPASDLIDKGVDVGLPYEGTAPDIGPFEYRN